VSQEYKYEAAFSFLQDDELIALEIGDRIRDRLNVGIFVYSQRQDELAGTDGVDRFSQIFAEESRIVVVLYREGWGQTRWTRVEETAIRTRGFNEGHEFVLLVKLDAADPPVWLPPTRLYLGFARHGVDGVAGAIEVRVQSVGGQVRSESVLDRAAIVARGIELDTERRQWRDSYQGVETAKLEAKQLFEELKSYSENVSSLIPQVQIRYNSTGSKSCEVSTRGTGFSVRWYNSAGNSLYQSGLIFEIWEDARFTGGRMVIRSQKYSLNYAFDIDATRRTGWRMSDDNRFLTTAQLSEYWIKRLIDGGA